MQLDSAHSRIGSIAALLVSTFTLSCSSTPPVKHAQLPPAAERVQPPPPAVPAVQPWSLEGLAKGAVLLPQLGPYKRKQVTTSSEEARAFFDQGLALTYGFNHDEAARSFARAAQIDPTCALCFWGAAYTLGPNYNIPMLPERAAAAWDALTRAQQASSTASPVEAALINALAKRYKGPEYVDPEGMAAFNQAYADAMRPVAKQFPADADVQVLFAEALMNLNPWKLWTPDGKPTAHTDEIVKTLEGVIKKSPKHPGANHYYIHAVEASKKPQRAVASADRLPLLMPGAGHMVHMPAHIYQRVGRYADASKANTDAIAADELYLKTVTPPGYYPFYLSHNHGFLAFSASMEGRTQTSLTAARASSQTMPRDVVCGMPGMDFFLSEPYLVMVRFGLHDELLREPKPDAKYRVQMGLWHHGQGMALAAKGKSAQAREHAAAIRSIANELPAEMHANLNVAKDVLALAALIVEARSADVDKDPAAVSLWRQAVALEDQLAYSEPADWFYPVRHYLGAALLDAGDAKAAEAVYRADLERNPKNGWAYYGLWQALAAQKRTREAKAAERDFQRAWSQADIQLTRSAL